MGIPLTKHQILLKLRRCSSIETLEKIIEHNKYTLHSEWERENFNSAADHRLAELTLGRNYDKIPAVAWELVK